MTLFLVFFVSKMKRKMTKKKKLQQVYEDDVKGKVKETYLSDFEPSVTNDLSADEVVDCIVCESGCQCESVGKTNSVFGVELHRLFDGSDDSEEELNLQRDGFWAESDSDQTLTSTSSVYEEPSDIDSDEDIMVEIVRDRLLNGWTSEEEEEEELIFEDFFEIEKPEIVEVKIPAEETKTDQVIIKQEELVLPSTPVVKILPNLPYLIRKLK
jgi:hypothetical protein